MIYEQRCKITVLPIKARFTLHPKINNRKAASGQAVNEHRHSILSYLAAYKIAFKLKELNNKL